MVNTVNLFDRDCFAINLKIALLKTTFCYSVIQPSELSTNNEEFNQASGKRQLSDKCFKKLFEQNNQRKLSDKLEWSKTLPRGKQTLGIEVNKLGTLLNLAPVVV